MFLSRAFPRKHPRGATVSAARMLSRTSSNDFWRGRVQARPQAPMNWWCISLTMHCATCRKALARRSRTARRWRWRRRGGWAATGPCLGVVKGDKGEPLAVGRRTRAVPPAIRQALRVRDGGCRFPGCDRSRFTHAHHIKHSADGGETRLDNLVTLCSQHHRLVHEGGYGVCVKEGEIRFTRPNGRETPPAGVQHGGCFRGNSSATVEAQPAEGAQRLRAANAARGVSIDAQTACCRWGGERMDFDIAIDALCREAGFR